MLLEVLDVLRMRGRRLSSSIESERFSPKVDRDHVEGTRMETVPHLTNVRP